MMIANVVGFGLHLHPEKGPVPGNPASVVALAQQVGVGPPMHGASEIRMEFGSIYTRMGGRQ